MLAWVKAKPGWIQTAGVHHPDTRVGEPEAEQRWRDQRPGSGRIT